MPRRRVLFIEDEPALRLSYERAFALRYDASFAATGAEALTLLKEHRPDVAVLDLRLPDTDGIDLLRKLRVRRPDLAVIITSAYVSLEPQLAVLAIPHNGYLVKPFDLAELARRIDDVR
jgi:DNA-binding response OmpR family regulator